MLCKDQTPARGILKQVALALVEDIRMEEDGNSNMSATKKGIWEISIVSSSPHQYAFILFDARVNSVQKNTVFITDATTYNRAYWWKK